MLNNLKFKTKKMTRKNTILILVDQVIRDTIAPYSVGEICKTPNISNLSKNSIVFDNAYTTISLCSPARASLFTGKIPHKHGMLYNNTSHIYGKQELENPDDMISFPLIKAGYKCGYVGKWHIDKHGPNKYGFEGTKFAGYGIRKETSGNERNKS